MIVYRDIISGDEMLSDAFKLQQVIDAEGNEVYTMYDFFLNDNISVTKKIIQYIGPRINVC